MRYQYNHIRNLANEARSRFDHLLYALQMRDNDWSRDAVNIDGLAIRLAVDDFKVILAEIRRLK